MIKSEHRQGVANAHGGGADGDLVAVEQEAQGAHVRQLGAKMRRLYCDPEEGEEVAFD